MRTRRILVVALAVVGAGLFATTPAQAGNWEETLLDPPPARIEAGVTYTFGYWILQHGSYPYLGGADELGPTGLRASDGKGAVVDFPGVRSKTDGHYSAEVVFPHNGEWTISSTHEVIMPDEDVATVTVPGAVTISPSQMQERAPYKWGKVRPSYPATGELADTFPTGPRAAPLVEERDVAPRGHQVAEPAGTDLPVWLVIGGGVATIGFALFLARRFRRVNR